MNQARPQWILFPLAFLLSFSAQAGEADWSLKGLEPLFQSCSQGIMTYDKVFEGLEGKARKQIREEGVKKFRGHFEAKDDFYEFVVLLAPHLIPDEVEFGSLYLDCWAAFEHFKEVAPQKNKTKKVQALSRWESCQKDAFRQDLPKLFAKAHECYQNWIK